MRRSYVYVSIRVMLLSIALIVFYSYVDSIYMYYLTFSSAIISIFAIGLMTDKYIWYSYLGGLAIISAFSIVSTILYGLQLYRVEYIYLYTSIIPLLVTLTPGELSLLTAWRYTRILFYILLVSKLITVYVSIFWRSLEFYNVYYRGSRTRRYLSAVKTTVSSQPYMVVNIAEYLHVYMNTFMNND